MPTRVTVTDNDLATLWYHPEIGIGHLYFKKAVCGRAFREVMDAGRETLKEHGATRWLSDARNNTSLTPEDAEWLDNVWSEAAIQAGWRHWATVLPEYVVGKMDMAQYIAAARRKGINVRVFSDPDEALEWLSSPDPVPYSLPSSVAP